MLLTCNVPNRFEPQSQRLAGILEDSTGDNRNPITTFLALIKFIIFGPSFMMIAAGTKKTIWPPKLVKVLTASFFCRKTFVKFHNRFRVIFHAQILHIVGRAVKCITQLNNIVLQGIKFPFLLLTTSSERSKPVSRRRFVYVLVIGLVVCSVSGVQAAGFAILQQGTAAMAQGNAFVAQADDPSAIFYNPAGLTQLKRPEIYFNKVFSMTNRTYTSPQGSYTTAEHKIFVIPAFYAVLPVHERVVLGLGTFMPFGLGTTWPPSWDGRFLTTRSKLETINVNPVVAVKVLDNLSFAAGFNVLWSKVQIQRRGLRVLPPLIETKNDFKGDGFGYGYNLGLLYEPLAGIKFGVSYRSEIKVTHKGDLRVSLVDPVGSKASVVFPPSVTWGVAYSRLNPFVFEVDVTWTGWSTYKDLNLNLSRPIPGMLPGTTISGISQEKNWQDAWAFRFGGNYQIKPGMKARAGYIYDMTPVPGSTLDPTIPDANRHIFTLGGDTEISRFTLGFAYNYIKSENRTKNNMLAISGVPLPPAFQANGRYKSDNHSLGLSLSCKF